MNDEAIARGPARHWRTLIGVMIGMIGAALIGVLVFRTLTTSQQRDDAVVAQQHSYEVMILARDLDATMGNAEATLGRFVISGDKKIGQIYVDGWRRAGTLLDKLASETSGRADQNRLTAELRAAYAARGEELGAVALRTNYRQNAQALSKYYDAGRSPTLARLRYGMDRIVATERATLDMRTIAAESSIATANRYAIVVAITGLILALCAAWLGWSAWSARARRRAEEQRNEDLEAAVDERTAELRDANARLLTEIAERAEAEQRLHQAQKMDVVGQLTGGIAHDFNNMLSVVIGGIELAKRRMASGSAGALRHLDQAMEGANRAAVLTKRLLAFARAEPLLPTAAAPGALIANMIDMFDRTLGDRITVSVQAEATWPIFADAHQLENVLLNLAVNARDAMPDGGTLTISTANIVLSDGEVAHAAPGDYVCIAVRDAGSGIPPEAIERVFEPFFTTKPRGRGTGLGLSQALGFARQSGGGIAIASTPGRGTIVSLYLPRHHGDGAIVPRHDFPAERHHAHHPGRVALVIEDDPRVLNATVEALRELGHDPVPCATAAQVPLLLRARRDIALIVSDVLLPGITGPELVAAIRTVHPAMPVLFVTGFAGDIDDAAQFGGAEVLRKPFTIAALGAAIDRAVSAESEAQAQAA